MYLPGTQDYLVPHAARTFLNALAFHKKLFGFEPSEEITVLMLDLEDSGMLPRRRCRATCSPFKSRR